MPTPGITDDVIGHLLPLFQRQMQLIRKQYKRRGGALALKNASGQLFNSIDDMAKGMRAMIVIYLGQVSDLHLRIAFHGRLLKTNANANALGAEIVTVLRHLSGATDNLDEVVLRICSLEAHHFIPATGWNKFKFLQMLFPDQATMPAVNLLRIEHQGPAHLIQQLTSTGNLPGILGTSRKKALTDNMTTMLNAIGAEVDEVGRLARMSEKQKALLYLDELEGFYDKWFPDIDDQGTGLLDFAADLEGNARWTARDWLRETRQNLAGLADIPGEFPVP
jgi:hypothetical protein